MSNVVDSEIWRERLSNEATPLSYSSSARVRYMARDAFCSHYNPGNMRTLGRSVSPMGSHPHHQGPFATGSPFVSSRKPFGDPLSRTRAQTANPNASSRLDPALAMAARRTPSSTTARLFKNSYETEYTRNFVPPPPFSVGFDNRFIPLAPLSNNRPEIDQRNWGF